MIVLLRWLAGSLQGNRANGFIDRFATKCIHATATTGKLSQYMNHNRYMYRDRVNIANTLLIHKRKAGDRVNMIYWWSDNGRFCIFEEGQFGRRWSLLTRLEQLLQVRYPGRMIPVDLLFSCLADQTEMCTQRHAGAEGFPRQRCCGLAVFGLPA